MTKGPPKDKKETIPYKPLPRNCGKIFSTVSIQTRFESTNILNIYTNSGATKSLFDQYGGPEKGLLFGLPVGWIGSLTSESVEGAALPLEGVDDVHGGDGLPLGVLSVGDGIPDDVLKEDLEDTTGLLVDESRDTLDSSTASQTPDGRLGDSLDVVTKNFPMALRTSLPKPLASFAASRHGDSLKVSFIKYPGKQINHTS